MKTIKHMLLATFAVAVLGGIVAFKLRGSLVYCADINHFGAIAGTPDCPLFQNSTYIIGAPAISFCTSVVDTPCTGQVKQIRAKQ